ncbi:MAG: hypothetical protein ACM3ON_03200 [Chloroflexota bacterium]
MEIRVEKSDPHMIEERTVMSWPIWKKEVSRFDWHHEPPRTGGASIELSKRTPDRKQVSLTPPPIAQRG